MSITSSIQVTHRIDPGWIFGTLRRVMAKMRGYKVSHGLRQSNGTVMKSIEGIFVVLLRFLLRGGYFGWRFCGTGGCPGNPSTGRKRKKDELHVRRSYVRKPYVGSAPTKTHSEPRIVTGPVRYLLLVEGQMGDQHIILEFPGQRPKPKS